MVFKVESFPWVKLFNALSKSLVSCRRFFSSPGLTPHRNYALKSFEVGEDTNILVEKIQDDPSIQLKVPFNTVGRRKKNFVKKDFCYSGNLPVHYYKKLLKMFKFL